MQNKILAISVLILLSACGGSTIINESVFTASSGSSRSLTDVINQYRLANGLPSIPVSPSLTKVAKAHVTDLENNKFNGRCNLHSWSKGKNWSGCCYTDDHAQAKCMWDKPKEISKGKYTGNGYEISAMHSGVMTPRAALSMWRKSAGHHNVILNKDIWVNANWQAMGAAVSAHYAVVWFGKETDPAGNK